MQFQVNTPEEYAELQRVVTSEKFNDEYSFITMVITPEAHSDLFLQPQYFVNAPFMSMIFMDGNNVIRIYPNKLSLEERTGARIQFADGKHSLTGVLNNYSYYLIAFLPPSIPTVENIDSILRWNEATYVAIYDFHNITLDLLHRIDELSKLTKLAALTLSIQPDTYKQVNATRFIEKIPNLQVITFNAGGLNETQRNEFHAINPSPSTNWTSKVTSQAIEYYRPKHMGREAEIF